MPLGGVSMLWITTATRCRIAVSGRFSTEESTCWPEAGEALGLAEDMRAAENWDLDISTPHAASAGRTTTPTRLHLDGNPSYPAPCRKKPGHNLGTGTTEQHRTLGVGPVKGRTDLCAFCRLSG